MKNMFEGFIRKTEKAAAFFAKKNYLLYSIIIFGVLFKLLIFTSMPDLWWDSASYIGFGKYLLTFGKIGFFDPVRPIVLPLILGTAWKIGFDPIIFGVILQITAACVSVYLAYSIAQKLFGSKKTSLVAAFLMAIDPIIFNNSQHQLTETLAMTFALFGVNFYLLSHGSKDFSSKCLAYSGIFLALSFLTRFPFALVFASIFLLLLSTGKISDKAAKARKIAVLSFAFFLTTLPYLVLNFFLYKNPLYPIFRGMYEIGLAGKAINYPLTYYITGIPAVSLITILSLVGLYFLFKSWKEEKSRILLLLFLTGFVYHMFFVEVKVLRYAILFLPFLLIITAYGVERTLKLGPLARNFAIFLLVVSSFWAMWLDISYIAYTHSEEQRFLEKNYYNFFDSEKYYGNTLLSTNPNPAALSNVRLYSLFLPRVATLKDFEAKGEAFYVMFSSSDNSCDVSMEACRTKEEQEGEVRDYLLENYKAVYNVSFANTTYYVFESAS